MGAKLLHYRCLSYATENRVLSLYVISKIITVTFGIEGVSKMENFYYILQEITFYVQEYT